MSFYSLGLVDETSVSEGVPREELRRPKLDAMLVQGNMPAVQKVKAGKRGGGVPDEWVFAKHLLK